MKNTGSYLQHTKNAFHPLVFFTHFTDVQITVHYLNMVSNIGTAWQRSLFKSLQKHIFIFFHELVSLTKLLKPEITQAAKYRSPEAFKNRLAVHRFSILVPDRVFTKYSLKRKLNLSFAFSHYLTLSMDRFNDILQAVPYVCQIH